MAEAKGNPNLKLDDVGKQRVYTSALFSESDSRTALSNVFSFRLTLDVLLRNNIMTMVDDGVIRIDASGGHGQNVAPENAGIFYQFSLHGYEFIKACQPPLPSKPSGDAPGGNHHV